MCVCKLDQILFKKKPVIVVMVCVFSPKGLNGRFCSFRLNSAAAEQYSDGWNVSLGPFSEVHLRGRRG